MIMMFYCYSCLMLQALLFLGRGNRREIEKTSGLKLDGVGPVDNRPSPDKLHHLVNDFCHFYHNLSEP